MVAIAAVTVAAVLGGCSIRPVDPRQLGAAPVTPTSPTSGARYFTAPPTGVAKDPSARCIDAGLPNITLDDYLADWRVIFADQRRAHPEGSFPTDESSDQQRTEQWMHAPEVAAKVAPGADARFAADVCGLSTNDGALYSGPELRQVRAHVASAGRDTCIRVADEGTKAVWDSIRGLNPKDSDRAAAEYQVYSAIRNICPQLADFTVPPNQIKRCSDVRPDPSARKGELSICLGG